MLKAVVAPTSEVLKHPLLVSRCYHGFNIKGSRESASLLLTSRGSTAGWKSVVLHLLYIIYFTSLATLIPTWWLCEILRWELQFLYIM